MTLADRRSGAVSVVGDVTTSTHFTLDPGGERVLSAVSRAAGPKFPSYETTVTIQRHGSSETALLSEIAVRPEQNVQLQPNDVVFVQHEPRYFLVFGATGNPTSLSTTNRRFAFGDTHLMLADALATAGGLEDDRSNPDAVFLYRPVARQTLVEMNVVVTDQTPDMVPTIFMINFRDPAGYFIARQFPMHAEDTIYVSNAPAVDLAKFLSVLSTFTGSASSAGSLR